MDKKELALSTDQRNFTMVYNDFLDSKVLDAKEKIIFILLKRYLLASNETGVVFPKIETLMDQTNMSNKTVVNILKNLRKKGVLKVKRQGQGKSNLYTLYDYKEMWECRSTEEVAAAIDNKEVENAIKLLQKKGLIPDTDQSTDIRPIENFNLSKANCSTKNENCQEMCKVKHFTEQEIKSKYDYDLLLELLPDSKDTADIVIELLAEVLNSNAKTIRINKENMDASLVKGRFSKLNLFNLKYVIDIFESNTEKIKNTRSYMLTLLYNSYVDMTLSIKNQVNHDFNK